MQGASEKSPVQLIIIGVLGFGFLFGALFPLINNGLRTGMAGESMSGAATGMKQKELDERLSKVVPCACRHLQSGGHLHHCACCTSSILICTNLLCPSRLFFSSLSST